MAVIAFLCLLVLGSSTTFRVDDWDLVANRSFAEPMSFLTPFNQQLVIVPAVIFRSIFAIVGLRSYLPYLAVLLAIHVGTATVVRRLVATLSGSGAGMAAGVLVLFLGVGYENLNAAFQIGPVLATLTGLLALEAIGTRRQPARAAGLLLISLASHAVGVAFLASVIMVLLLRDRQHLRWIAVPILVFGFWFVAFDLPTIGSLPTPLPAAIMAMPLFMVVGPMAATGAIFGLSIVAGVILAVIGAAVATVARFRPANPILVLAAGSATLVEYGLIAVPRAAFGVQATGWSRYLYTAVPLILILVAAYVGSISRIRGIQDSRRAGLVLATLTAVAVVGNMRVYLSSSYVTSEYVYRVRAAAAIVMWSPTAGPMTSDPSLPSPARLRELFLVAGSPVRDDLLMQVVTPVPDPLARQACLEMLGPAGNIDACLAVIRDKVGAP